MRPTWNTNAICGRHDAELAESKARHPAGKRIPDSEEVAEYQAKIRALRRAKKLLSVLLAVLAFMFVTTGPAGATAQTLSWGLTSWYPPGNGYTYTITLYGSNGAVLISPDNSAWFVFQPDGNAVIYDNTGGLRVKWASNTRNTAANTLELQADGNLVIYRANGSVVWASGTNESHTMMYRLSLPNCGQGVQWLQPGPNFSFHVRATYGACNT
jgi:hypothetical protein